MKNIFSAFYYFRFRYLSGLAGILLVLITSALFAQSSSIKLPTADSSSSFRVLDNNSTVLLRLNGDAGFYYGGTYGTGVIPATGAGTRLMWYPAKGAFRVGGIDGSQWDDANIGEYSIAMSNNAKASGAVSTAIGAYTTATGGGSTAIGLYATASADYSTAIGQNTAANAPNSMAMGTGTIAGGIYSSAIGYDTRSDGSYSTAMGWGTTAGSYSSTAIGQFNIGGGNAVFWNDTDPIFEIGIGADASNKADAVTVLKNGNVGIGTYSPGFKLTLDNDGGIIAKGTLSMGATLPSLGGGTRLIWYPRKASFRAGYASSTQWDDASVGNYSIAIGYSTIASGQYSTAMGGSTIASGQYSTAMGLGTTASGSQSTAFGVSTVASGSRSTAFGYNTTASTDYAIAIGYYTTASGWGSTAIGCYVSTNSQLGACFIGDASTAVVSNSSINNQMTMRFAGGYRLFSNSTLTTGVYMSGGVSGWTNYCDRNKKENFRPVDGEQLLLKIRTLPITEWNYKGTDASIKYIGPVAQDFYSAFHLGGEDSLGINSICIDGVNMAAIQALEKRTAELREALKELKAEKEKVTVLELKISFLEQKIEIIERIFASYTTRN